MFSEEIFTLLTQEYSISLATSKKDFEEVKKIRDDVFNHRYAIYPELKKESWYLYNEEDKQSFIYLLRDNITKIYVGTVRIFFLNQNSTIKKLPMEHGYLLKKDKVNYPICEISRFSLLGTLREHRNFSSLRLRTYLTLALMIATRINLFLAPYSHTYAIMESSLHRILKRQGVNFEQLADPISYYGQRIPFTISKNKLLLETESTMGKITRYYLKTLCENPHSFLNYIDKNPYLSRSDIELNRMSKLFEKYGEDVDINLLLGKEPLTQQISTV